ncbi:hypothetical protein ABZ359_34300 [Streptomyces sp. NPDC005968]|uniref:hypothetical protein n=1 Tax=Streptomyces sp. NPDC005968 TaxID=3154574 RepID=UPI00340EE8A9
MPTITPPASRPRLRRVRIPGTVTVPAPCQALRGRSPGAWAESGATGTDTH